MKCPGFPEVGDWRAHYKLVHPDIKMGGPKTRRQVGRNIAVVEQLAASGGSTEIGRVRPGSTRWRIGGRDIIVDENDLFEALVLYNDLKARCGFKSSFSEMIKDSMSMVWKLMATKPILTTEQVIKVEVSNNGEQRDTAEDKAGVGGRQAITAGAKEG